ncbi:hypothetical protein GPECTOR_2g1448 [Gonium pectorale]|uniref:Transmembrane protein n=1 Tax=Gonium pectorale TaxID=33097 RepID=A0A150H168_GONPE|nr:hypothetical protein GPECTOR_2g1448 [Gonium pectorale]|eukprot:KXZ55897.1 hypothetical protein GPECTOR_2g1448 [Gonium pectorale]
MDMVTKDHYDPDVRTKDKDAARADQVADAALTTLYTVFALLIAMSMRIVKGGISDFVFMVSVLVVNVQFLTVEAISSGGAIGLCKRRKLTAICLYLINFYGLSLQLWFWAVGYRHLQSAACPGTVFWLFGTINAYGRFRVFMIVATSLAFVYALVVPIMLLACDVLAFEAFNARREAGTDAFMQWAIGPKDGPMPPRAKRQGCLERNDISGVQEANSTGQLIALLLGILCCARSMWQFLGLGATAATEALNKVAAAEEKAKGYQTA